MVDLQAKFEVVRAVISTIKRFLMNKEQGVTAMRGVVEVINTVKKKSYIFQILVLLKKCQQAMSRRNEGHFRVLQGQITLFMNLH